MSMNQADFIREYLVDEITTQGWDEPWPHVFIAKIDELYELASPEAEKIRRREKETGEYES